MYIYTYEVCMGPYEYRSKHIHQFVLGLVCTLFPTTATCLSLTKLRMHCCSMLGFFLGYPGFFGRPELQASHYRRTLLDHRLRFEQKQFLALLDDRFVNEDRNVYAVLVAGKLQLRTRRQDERHILGLQ